jgi:CRP/FNR family transcriptional regulator, cyclic AMP receptor protein
MMQAPTATQLSALADDSLRELAPHGTVRTLPKGAVIIHEGDAGDSMYVILSGRVKIYVADEEGQEMVIDTRGPGEIVGEMILDGGPRTASVMCLEPSSFSVISAANLRSAITANPDFALRLISTLIARVRLTTDLVKDLALLDVYGRMRELLLKLAVEGDGKWVITDKLTHQDIADRVGSSRDMVTRIFKELTAGGYVTVENRQITIQRKLPAHR